MAFSALPYDPQDAREIVLVASVCERDRRIIEAFEEDRPDFRDYRAMMKSNQGVRL
jgi:predicted DNA-binding transcriptional regulator YafY